MNAPIPPQNPPLLSVIDLKMHFPVRGGVLKKTKGTIYALDGISFTVREGETLGIVGESGCGKTTAGRTILRLYPPTSGSVIFEGKDLARIPKKILRETRRRMQMIFQDPFESLDARQTVYEILEEPFLIHGMGNPTERKAKIHQLLDTVGLQKSSASLFPHEFSGGQRQRIGIARAIALNPRLIVCDEPVSALDVSIQSQILNLLIELQRERGLSYLFISHNLAVVKYMSESIIVMYLGKIVEHAPAELIYQNPVHPYTQALISAIPVPDPTRKRRRALLSGDIPSPRNPPAGCRFHTRCPLVLDQCRREEPLLRCHEGDPDRRVACHRSTEGIKIW